MLILSRLLIWIDISWLCIRIDEAFCLLRNSSWLHYGRMTLTHWWVLRWITLIHWWLLRRITLIHWWLCRRITWLQHLLSITWLHLTSILLFWLVSSIIMMVFFYNFSLDNYMLFNMLWSMGITMIITTSTFINETKYSNTHA